jgi:hypothetical protein
MGGYTVRYRTLLTVVCTVYLELTVLSSYRVLLLASHVSMNA